MKSLILLMLIGPGISEAGLWFEGGALTSFTSSKLTENSNSTTIEHSSSFVDPGLGFEARAGIHFPIVSLGVVGLIDWESSRLKYQPANQSIFSSTSYSNTRRRFVFGPTLVGHIPGGFRLAGEYLMKVADDITYAKPKSANPFAENDYLKGKGWGIGVGYELTSFFVQATFRKIKFNKAKMRGAATDLPNATFSKVDTSGLFLSFGVSFK